jgi:hypothetical protein
LEQEWLQRWWCKKYERPSKDPLLAEYTYEELFVEFMEDQIELDPEEAFPPLEEGEEVVYRNTGDKKIDQWEREIADGKRPSFEDDPAIKAWLDKKRSPPAAKKAVMVAPRSLVSPQPDGKPMLEDTISKMMDELEVDRG